MKVSHPPCCFLIDVVLSATGTLVVEGLCLSVQRAVIHTLCAGSPENLGDVRLSLEGVGREGFLRKWHWS